jgi:alpha-1,2-mannosyltransferase
VSPGREFSRSVVQAMFAALAISVLGSIVQFGVHRVFKTPYPPRIRALQAASVGRIGEDSLRPMLAAYQISRSSKGINVYQEVVRRYRDRFQYPSASLLPIWLWNAASDSALPKLGLDLSGWFQAISILCLIGVLGGTALLIVVGPTESARVSATWPLIAGGACMAAIFFPLLKGFSLGNVQLILNAMIVALLLAWRFEHKALCGVLVGMMSTYKPHYGILLLWALACEQYRFAAYAWGTILALVAISIPIFGVRIYSDYLQFLLAMGSRGHAFFANQSLNGFLNRWRGNQVWFVVDPTDFARYDVLVEIATTTAVLLLIGTMLYWCRTRRRPASSLDLALALVSITVAAPVAWDDHFGFLPGVLALLVRVMSTPLQRKAWVASYVLCADIFYLTHRLTLSNDLLLSTLFIGAMVILVLLYVVSRNPTNSSVHTKDVSRRRDARLGEI